MLFDKTTLKISQDRVPKISPSQRVALESGDALVEQSLFEGGPDWDTILGMAEQGLTEAEDKFINDPDGPVETLCRKLEEWGNHHNVDEDIPEDIWDFLKENQFFGMVLPPEYDGLGFSATAHALVVEKLTSVSLPAAVVAMVPNSLGPGELLAHFGTKEQKNKWLKPLANGELVPCFGLTEPEAGSDALNVQSTGEVYRDPEDGEIKVRVTFEKRYITLAPKADLIGLAVQLKDPENLLGEGTNPGITTILIDAKTEGVDNSKRHRPFGGGFRNGPMKGQNIVIPTENIIGKPGEGWKMLMTNLGIGRAISIPSLGTGILKSLTRYTAAYAQVRNQFGMAVGGFEGVKEPLAHMAGDTYRVESGRRFALDFVDVEGKNPSSLSVVMKYWATEMARDAVNHAIDIESGKAVMTGPNNHVAKFYEALLISIVGEGSNIMMRNLLIFGQSSVKSHPFLLDEADATDAATKAFAEAEILEKDGKNIEADAARARGHESRAELGRLSRKHIKQVLANTTKSFARHALPTSAPEQLKGSPMEKYARDINRMASMFSATADMSLMYLGGEIQRAERTSARLGDAMSHLYMAMSSIRRFEKSGRPEGDIPIAQWAIEDSLKQAEDALRATLENLPLRTLPKAQRDSAAAKLANIGARGLVRNVAGLGALPWGRWQKGPTDKLDHAVADAVSVPGEVRDRLTQGVYWPDPANSNAPEAVIERAFLKVDETNHIERKAVAAIRAATKAGKLMRKAPRDVALAHIFEAHAITQEEYTALQERDELRKKVVAVDVFTEDAQVHTTQWAKELKAEQP